MTGPRLPAALLRPGLRQLRRRVLNPDLPWEVQRRRLDGLMRTSLLPRGTVLSEADRGGVRCETVTAAGADTDCTVLHFHGGGYCIGSPLMGRSWAAQLSSQAGVRVIMPDYRLAPEHPHPAALDDAREVLKAVLAETAPGSVVVTGDSAGGGLALALTIARRDAGEELPAGCVLMSPWLNLAADRRARPELVRRDVLLSPGWLAACAAGYAGPAALADPALSPLNAELAGLPPLLIQAGTDELLAPDAGQLASRAAAAGVDVTYTRWPRMWHDFVLQAGLVAAADSAVAQAAWFTRQVARG
jgi:epsilon-lactone hydrolase